MCYSLIIWLLTLGCFSLEGQREDEEKVHAQGMSIQASKLAVLQLTLTRSCSRELPRSVSGSTRFPLPQPYHKRSGLQFTERCLFYLSKTNSLKIYDLHKFRGLNKL